MKADAVTVLMPGIVSSCIPKGLVSAFNSLSTFLIFCFLKAAPEHHQPSLFRQRGQSLSLNIRKSVQSAGHRHPGVNRGGVILSL
jgi:hypothetical protein